MSKKPINTESLVAAAFSESELKYLKTLARFITVFEQTKTTSDFVRLCEVSEALLEEYERANPAAQPFRSSLREDPKARHLSLK